MILSLVFNALYYKLHPMRVSMNPCGKLETPICGLFCCPFCSEDDEDFEVGAGFKTPNKVDVKEVKEPDLKTPSEAEYGLKTASEVDFKEPGLKSQSEVQVKGDNVEGGETELENVPS